MCVLRILSLHAYEIHLHHLRVQTVHKNYVKLKQQKKKIRFHSENTRNNILLPPFKLNIRKTSVINNYTVFEQFIVNSYYHNITLARRLQSIQNI